VKRNPTDQPDYRPAGMKFCEAICRALFSIYRRTSKDPQTFVSTETPIGKNLWKNAADAKKHFDS
jgi:hypothetical protein